ncbi:uncharacterized protein LOC129988630 [Argiope bruennichi]|uniref:uncharacterized protein LOC129988630 n=1 Tax=Argiope bruennichi TaxID=94029 RepID=UPI0024949B54|nr:uncharacterized protein LOC129988630 [Argiope bruennichi]
MMSIFQSLFVIFIVSLGVAVSNAQDASYVEENTTCASDYLFPMFPECKDYEDIIQEKRRELIEKGELQGDCQEDIDTMECIRSQLFYARRQIASLPPVECMQPLAEFLLGDLFDYVYESALEDAKSEVNNELDYWTKK